MSRKLEPELIKGLALDLDGTTLLPEAILGQRTKDCLRKLIGKGMQIIISTGRAIETAEKYLSAIGAEGPMVFFNGAEIADIPSGKRLYTNCISMDVVNYGVDVAHELGIHYQVYLPAGISPDTGKQDPAQKYETLIIEKYTAEAEYYQKHTGIVPVIRDIKTIAPLSKEGCIKGMFIADPSLHDEVRKKMNERFGGQIIMMRSYPTFLEVLNKGVSKGEALNLTMKYRGLKPQEVIAFGDEENDLSMFPAVGFACAPQNAREKIKEAADFVYGPNTEEGLAVFLEKTFL
jgi:hypothetical protein